MTVELLQLRAHVSGCEFHYRAERRRGDLCSYQRDEQFLKIRFAPVIQFACRPPRQSLKDRVGNKMLSIQDVHAEQGRDTCFYNVESN